jgi:transcriptional regulator with XRE-family HTH domain
MKVDNRPKRPKRISKRKTIRSYAEFAKILGIDRSYICKIYQGKCLPSLPLAIQMAKVLGISINSLIKTFPRAKTAKVNHIPKVRGKIYIDAEDEE